MANKFVLQRLEGLQSILIGVHRSGSGLSSATVGQERASFIDEFLANIIPPTYRFGTGDVTDAAGNKSGQLDVVIELPFAPSLPMVGSGQTRLYLAESVAAVIEVKSDLARQWDQATLTAKKLATVNRRIESSISFGPMPSEKIPLFVVGYTGWTTVESLVKNFDQCPEIMGTLIIDGGLYISRSGIRATGPWALWALISDLFAVTSTQLGISSNPISYAMQG